MVFLYKNKWVLTHELTFFEDPVLFRLLWQPVRISVAFTSEIRRAEQLKRFLERFFPDDYVGGPAYGDPGSEFTDGLYLRKGITINELWFAADKANAIRPLRYAADLFRELPLWKKRAYVMIGYDGESLDQAEARLEEVYNMGILPFWDLYRPEELAPTAACPSSFFT